MDRLPLCGRLNRANNMRELAGPDVPYLIIYRPVEDVVEVIAIFDTCREPVTKRQP
jgi:hypothetical protein